MYFLITCQPKRVNSPGGTSLLPAMVGSDVPSLICILSVEILWTEIFKKNCLNSCPESKELLRITRDNWVLVSMRGRRLLVLMCTKYYVNNYIRERVMTIFFVFLLANELEFNGDKQQLCQYACATHPMEVGLFDFLFLGSERQSNRT